MKIEIVLLIFFSSILNLTAQQNVNFGISISYNNNNYQIKRETSRVLGTEISSNQKNELTNTIGISLWTEIPLGLNKRISFLTGIEWFSYNLNQTVGGLIFNSDIDPMIGVISTSEINNRAVHSYIGIPLALKVNFSPKNNEDEIFFALGIEPAGVFTKREQSKIFYGNGAIEELAENDSKLNSFSLLSIFHLGYNKRLSNNFSLSIAPFLKISLKETGERYNIESPTRYLSFGGNFGILYHLK